MSNVYKCTKCGALNLDAHFIGGKIYCEQCALAIESSLKYRIAKAGMTQTEFAEKMGVSRQQVNNWTSGRSNMSLVYKLKADDILK